MFELFSNLRGYIQESRGDEAAELISPVSKLSQLKPSGCGCHTCKQSKGKSLKCHC
ncbi:hypothetical protein kac68v162_gp022 [Nodularia phage vB_NspS-kac68v162]|uniref:Uncharacterized protein n=2 Tax=Ravarandavirus kac68v161 TaxID=2845690 RepID=A0A482MLB4_9CAUD|nr:hypothetical protein HWC13_gp022 [Nodularia phage vB_NspS-kac68v161]QBQ73672.1 hypothetical protein kac68v161_gp022 [Nodularia phage vB_NspS-kac68v161]QBQ73870.1 hypothetical protein kac68v162_gp022 [Nodularia phage vB_NspS-kac68v162]